MLRPNLWYLPPAFLFAGGPWVRPAPGLPCALSRFRGRSRFDHSGSDVPRERERMPSWLFEIRIGCFGHHCEAHRADLSAVAQRAKAGAIQTVTAEKVWIASRSLSSGRAFRE